MRINLPADTKGEKRIIDAFAAQYGYQAEIETAEGPHKNPQSPEDFFKAKVAEYVNGVVAAHETTQATEKARAKALSAQPPLPT